MFAKPAGKAVSLNLLGSRAVRREELLSPHVPDPIVDRADGVNPEHEACSPTPSGSPSSSWSRH